MLGDETELLRSLLTGLSDDEKREAVSAINEAPPEKPAGRRRRRASKVSAPSARVARATPRR